MVTPGRRELHKRATRQALQEAATRMFEERGYADTTVRDIAEAVGVTERTFFRYFPSKEDLLLGEVLDLIPELGRLVRARPGGEEPYAAVCNALLDLAEQRGMGVGILFSGLPGRAFSRSGNGSVLLDFEDALMEALRDRLTTAGVEAKGLRLRASVLARASVAAMRATVAEYHELPAAEQTLQAARGLLRRAFDMLR
ncbi:TetR family transcriptional regulator [Nonomuraea dietziae]|uniref:AcrR family transcriptional regulator n=1 Tax=Nonomuraea dietziae TaxID=65515 RepID=A0A7W5V1K6_9ACTN|nr:TetR family transcriptional regulator [Nonomuraea dietziae]MBB3724159.1 AcrR family transcriptional regulator [Nonomuraea dietziae]